MFGNASAETITVLPVKGDNAVFAASQPILKVPAYRGANTMVLVPPGTFVVADREANNSLGNNPSETEVSFGVGIDLNKNGITDYIRWVDNVDSCGFETLEAVQPTCGQTAIVTALFGNCVECGVTYTFEVVWHNNETRSFAKENRGYRYTFSYTVPCQECDGCPTSVNADELMCGLYNAINLGENGDWNIEINGELQAGAIDFPFYVSKLYDGADPSTDITTYEWSFSPNAGIDDTCMDCINYQPIGGISSAGTAAIDTTFDPVLYVDDGGTIYSRSEHLELIAEEITQALGGRGDARVVKCVGRCCDWKLEVNTCVTDFVLLDDQDVAIAPTNTSNPFSSGFDVNQECIDCDNPQGSTTFARGLRFRAKSQFIDCDCVAGNYAKGEYSADIEVFPKFGFAPNDYRIIRDQEPTEPKGQGITWQKHEYTTIRRGMGQELLTRGHRSGEHNTPGPDEAVAHVATKCDQKYCVLSVDFHTSVRKNNNEPLRSYKRTVYVLLEEGADTAAASIQGFFTNYANTACGSVSLVGTCVAE